MFQELGQIEYRIFGAASKLHQLLHNSQLSVQLEKEPNLTLILT